LSTERAGRSDDPACSENKICASGAFYSVTRRIEFAAPIRSADAALLLLR